MGLGIPGPVNHRKRERQRHSRHCTFISSLLFFQTILLHQKEGEGIYIYTCIYYKLCGQPYLNMHEEEVEDLNSEG